MKPVKTNTCLIRKQAAGRREKIVEIKLRATDDPRNFFLIQFIISENTINLVIICLFYFSFLFL